MNLKKLFLSCCIIQTDEVEPNVSIKSIAKPEVPIELIAKPEINICNKRCHCMSPIYE